MTEGHGTCGQVSRGINRPRRGRTTSILALVRPLRGRLGESMSAIRRFHDLRSFHPRLLRVRPLRGRQNTTYKKRIQLLSLFNNRIFCKLQQKLLGAGMGECHRCLGILARAFKLQNFTYAETLMLYLASFPKRRRRCRLQ